MAKTKSAKTIGNLFTTKYDNCLTSIRYNGTEIKLCCEALLGAQNDMYCDVVIDGEQCIIKKDGTCLYNYDFGEVFEETYIAEYGRQTISNKAIDAQREYERAYRELFG